MNLLYLNGEFMKSSSPAELTVYVHNHVSELEFNNMNYEHQQAFLTEALKEDMDEDPVSTTCYEFIFAELCEICGKHGTAYYDTICNDCKFEIWEKEHQEEEYE